MSLYPEEKLTQLNDDLLPYLTNEQQDMVGKFYTQTFQNGYTLSKKKKYKSLKKSIT